MMEQQRMVLDFMKKFGQPYLKVPGFPSPKQTSLSLQLLTEEVTELAEAIDELELTEVVDSLGDIMYVCLGAANRFGIDMEPIFQEIHRSNMTKEWPEGTPHHYMYTRLGKYLKPPTYSRPNLQPILDGQKEIV